MPTPTPDALLRPIPFPYSAMIAICSDLDETPDKRVYLESSRYLNTTEATCMGPGVGLEVGNTIYFDMPSDQFSYWNTDDGGREVVRALIRSGHIDCLHSFGDYANSRSHCERALSDLQKHNCRLETWIDHAIAPSNFGGDIMKGSGDVVGSPVYHADLTTAFGVRYVWRGRVTSVIGQNVARNFGGIFDGRHVRASTKTVAKELAKVAFSYAGNQKYAIHRENAILRDEKLRDGTPVLEFLRCNPYWMGVNRGETAAGIAEVLSERMLDRLIEREALCILYTHLGKVMDPREPFQRPTRDAFERLARRFRSGKLLVTTTRRLIGFCRAMRDVCVSASRHNDWTHIKVSSNGVPHKDLPGLTIYCDDPAKATLEVDGNPVAACQNGPDDSRQKSVSIAWKKLQYPAV